MAADDPTWKKFVFGGMSCMSAACVTNPIDVIKIRLQIQGELQSVQKEKMYNGFIRGMGTIVKNEGIGGLYKGLTASVMREGSYSTIRMGLYDVVRDMFGQNADGTFPLYKKILAGGTAGAMGSAIANPTDLVKVRLQAHVPGQPPAYTSTIAGFTTIYKNEGFKGLYRGVGPTTQRAALLTAAQLPSYDQTKRYILKWELMNEGMGCHFASSMVAGLIAATVTSPVDLVKTRVMNQVRGPDGSLPYKNAFDCLTKTVKAEGVLGLYKGWFPNWMRIGPHTIVTFLIYEQLRKFAGMKPVHG